MSGKNRIVLCAGLLGAASAAASQFDIVGPAGSHSFGTAITLLPNGNIVVSDPDYDEPGAAGVGAVRLYSAAGALISTLKGSTAGDHVGSDGIVVLANGNFVVCSGVWHNGSAAGAVTWAPGGSGVDGVVSIGNSLVGAPGDEFGSRYYNPAACVVALTNGNFVVPTPKWNGARGAATWGNGATGSVGAIGAQNSLVGTSFTDQVGKRVVPLTNGNYVVVSRFWDNTVNAYAQNWQDAGAVTWGNGSTGKYGPAGVYGQITESNSMVGKDGDNLVSTDAIVALANGNYVFGSPNFSSLDPLLYHGGAATWVSGSTGTPVGYVSTTNSLVGHSDDALGYDGIVALTNGNYVVISRYWSGGKGAVTWANGAAAATGFADAATNSLVGSVQNDFQDATVVALSNGNYVVSTPKWDGGGTDKGAVTWGNGASGSYGMIGYGGNVLTGSTSGDMAGASTVVLTNGNYVTCAPGFSSQKGALSWGNGSGGTTGTVSTLNSLAGYGTTGLCSGGVTPLRDGNYVVSIPSFSPSPSNFGAALWADGGGPIAGLLSGADALVGGKSGDAVSGSGVFALSNGHYVVASQIWDSAIADAGAVTWGNGRTGTRGTVVAGNSLAGGSANGKIGSVVRAFANGNFAVIGQVFDSNTFTYSTAITLLRGFGPTAATFESLERITGGFAAATASFDYDAGHDQLVVGRPALNRVTVLKPDLIFRHGLDD